MIRIPFADIRVPPPGRTQAEIQARLREHYRKIDAERHDLDRPMSADGTIDEDRWLDRLHAVDVPSEVRERIQRRAACLAKRYEAASGLSHLKSDDRKRLEPLHDGVHLVGVASEHRADEIAAEIHAEMPWMSPATDLVWHAMRRSVREGWPGLRVPPILLDGPPGIGKSHWARLLGDAISAPTTVIEATGENASFGVVGSQRGWGGSCPGRLIETVIQSRIANPVMVVDEIEKAGTPTSMKGLTFGLAEALLPLLEPIVPRQRPWHRFEVVI
ncbi:AAA family ATPase [Paracoccus siganidrum]|uniref:AAA family ATPase n=1 Tax=Paracoccus siganidrum TaxID=1276757 RepID=UPI001604ADB2|nr:AAA family ATPase [Paracoccus siganidrum]